ARIDHHVRSEEAEQVREIERHDDGDPGPARGGRQELLDTVGADCRHTRKLAAPVEDRVSEGHGAPTYRRLRAVVEHDPMTGRKQTMGDGGADVGRPTDEYRSLTVRPHDAAAYEGRGL